MCLCLQVSGHVCYILADSNRVPGVGTYGKEVKSVAFRGRAIG